MTKVIKVKDFADELMRRIEKNNSIDCCKEEIKKLANMSKKYMADVDIEVNWKE